MCEASSNWRVLLVEDNAGDAVLLKRALRRACSGIVVVSCETAEAALALLRTSESHFDLLVTDINLPGMSGIGLLEQLIDIRGVDFLPAVVISSSRAPKDVSAALTFRAKDYLVKPYSLGDYDVIANKLTSICSNHHAV